jgi:hypothetical protein
MVDYNNNALRKYFNNELNSITEELRALRQSKTAAYFKRVIVVDVISDPASLNSEDIESLTSRVKQDFLVTTLPRNCIIGKHVRSPGNSSYDEEIFYPFFSSHLSLPVKPGEHVWVFYEGDSEAKQDRGFWLSRIHERRDVEDANYTHSDRQHFEPAKELTAAEKINAKQSSDEAYRFSFNNGLNTPQTYTLQTDSSNGYDDLYSEAKASNLGNIVAVPRYTSRPGDLTIQGSNNQLISLGTGRISASDLQAKEYSDEEIIGSTANLVSGQDKGTIDIVVGRGQTSLTSVSTALNSRGTEANKTIGIEENLLEGDPDFDTDAARVYLATNTSIDSDFGINLTTPAVIGAKVGGIESEVNNSQTDKSATLVKADQIRLVARNDIKIVLSDPSDSEGMREASITILNSGDIIITPGKQGVIKLGGEDADKAILMTDAPATNAQGQVTATPILTTMGGLVGTSVAGQGTFSTKVLIK